MTKKLAAERKEILRADCPLCRGNGYVVSGGSQTACGKCGGVGMIEAAVDYRPEGYDAEDVEQILGVRPKKWTPERDDE